MRSRQRQEAYRVAAAQMVAGEPLIKVQPYGLVHPCEGGAFVELVLWVPEDLAVRAQAAIDEAELVSAARERERRKGA